MKRILCILSSLHAGGAETFLMKVYRALPPLEYQMDFVVSEENGIYTEEVLERGGHIWFVPMRSKNVIGAFFGIMSIVRENGYQSVLKIGDRSVSVVDLIAAKFGGARYLAMRSCNALTGLSITEKTVHAVLRPLLNWVANVKLAPSMLAAEFTFGKRQAHKNVHLLHNGVDLSIFRYDAVARNSIREEFSLGEKLVVGHVGRFHKQKNHIFLLEVFRKIKDRRKDAVLLLVGTGERENDIRCRVKELGLESSVIFAGVRFNVPALLSAMDVFVFPSLHEGMPNTVIEAQATGLPCVIADTITREADITGLVSYLSLRQSWDAWASQALACIRDCREDTAQKFLDSGYDIQSVAENLIHMVSPTEK